jgi:hypothetical protein
MELQFLVTNEILMEPESRLNFGASAAEFGVCAAWKALFCSRCIAGMQFGRIAKRCAAERRANNDAPMIRGMHGTAAQGSRCGDD